MSYGKMNAGITYEL